MSHMQLLGLLELSQNAPRNVCDFASWPQSAQDLALTGDLFGALPDVPLGRFEFGLVRVAHLGASCTTTVTRLGLQMAADLPLRFPTSSKSRAVYAPPVPVP